jgi:energy-coupling factor transporter ATP-binding protein EcfA2
VTAGSPPEPIAGSPLSQNTDNAVGPPDIVVSVVAPGAKPAPDCGPTPDSGADVGQAGNEVKVTQAPPPEAKAAPVRPRVPPVRVDARLLEATLLNLRKRIAGLPLVFELPAADEVAAERTKLLSQIDDYLLPRVRRSAAPLLVALVGSTGAGKSTLVNSIVGTQVSATGVRRPTTNSPVLACHPDDIGWFAENMFLPTLPRVRQEGLARPGRDGLLVLAASEGMAKGIALLDTPDIDSVVRAHHEFAYQFLDASDLWLFMTSATRYADAPVWEILQHARDRGAALGVVLSRVPPSHRDELVEHFSAMLDANDVSAADRFVIPETPIVEGMLPEEIFGPIRDWLAQTAQQPERRVAVLTQTMSGVLDTFKTRVPRLAAHVDAQVALRNRLRRDAEETFRTALAEFDTGTRDGALLGGEVLARWQDCAASGDLDDALRARKARKGRRARKGPGPTRIGALDEAVRAAIEALVVSVADRASERVTARWNESPAGSALLARADAARAKDERVEQVFTDAFGDESKPARGSALDRAASDLPARSTRAVSGWQDQLIRMVSGQRSARYDGETMSLVLALAMLSQPRGGAALAEGEGIAGAPHALLAKVAGGDQATELIARARADLAERVRLLLDEELLRYVELLASAGQIDEIAAVRLYQAEYSLEAAR